MGNNKVFYIILSVLMLASAGGILWWATRPSVDPDIEANPTSNYVCQGCGEHYSLTEKQLAAWDADEKRFELLSIPRMKHVFPAYLCDKCKQMAVVTAQHCPDHDIWYPVYLLDGAQGVCPECKKQRR